VTNIDEATRTGQARDYGDGHIRQWTATDEAEVYCYGPGHARPRPCPECVAHAERMLAVAAEMYEGGYDPDDTRRVGFSDGWWAVRRHGGAS
jgi:hypothetical protein